ncbi:fasciclin domain-containing protein [Flammeovirga yaeyamensis]|uniref:Fasciclin domain-containing protein n=1 Tax=Flammeovirga yaeyamensis TaxID=367791 RepID=A0AAX1ND30_9BACT|nr:fasciclin domain-containing protein [Flammeovirga yaeyamensis]MBB3696629.1 putative surface protein with fasciclin (FAS1) repeats [Flammeovirga yaeyamensis]NMF33302.1 hypothetical protein [Flammeovirga yaeyamensis]QWG05419.1 fasciclin domain-containing protein [Flammeovirga yaeyamensis]
MKGIIKKISNIFLLIGLVAVSVSCDLQLQKEWKYVPEPAGNKPTGMTAMEWITMINADTTYNDANGDPEFKYLLEAINHTGLSELYSDESNNRTFFILRNSAFVGSNQLISDMTGSPSTPIAEIEVERLTKALKYHIVSEELSQETIPKNDFFFYYQTLVEGEEGEIEIHKRLFNQQMRINTKIDRVGSGDTPTNMPSTSKGRGVDLHNYIFNNGIGHQINGYVRYTAF